MESTIFTRILNKELPGEIMYEDEFVFVIPDIFPSVHGQVLVITKRQVPYIFELEQNEYEGLMRAVQKVAKALDKAFETVRTCVVIEGFDVPHVHVRLYPCVTEELVWSTRSKATNEELMDVANRVRTALA